MPEPREYPKWVKGVVVQNHEEEEAVSADTAVCAEVGAAAEGLRSKRVVGIKPGLLARLKARLS